MLCVLIQNPIPILLSPTIVPLHSPSRHFQFSSPFSLFLSSISAAAVCAPPSSLSAESVATACVLRRRHPLRLFHFHGVLFLFHHLSATAIGAPSSSLLSVLLVAAVVYLSFSSNLTVSRAPLSLFVFLPFYQF